MPGRNLAKPFAIAGFILAEFFMFFVVLGPYSSTTHALPMAIPEPSVVAPGTPQPLKSKVTTLIVMSFFMGPLGAAVGTGIGLTISGLRGDFRQNRPRQE